MKALVFHNPKDVRIDTVNDPIIKDDTDVILRVTSTAICGSDLHIYNGMFPQPRNMVLGHEFMGIVEDVGRGVTKLKKGDRVVVPFPIACGNCHFCNMGLEDHCERSNPEHYGPEGGLMSQKGGALFGYTDLYGGYDGGQAEYVRVPYADIGPRIVPPGLSDEQVLFLTDIFPTGYSAVKWAGVKGGDTVAVFGCGPVGIMAMKSARIMGAGKIIAVDILPYRLEKARIAADVIPINAAEVNPVEAIRELTGGYGADVCIDAVGMEASRTFMEKAMNVLQMEKGTMKILERCFSAVRRGGAVSVVGVYGSPYDNFPLYQFFDKGIKIFGGQAWAHRYIGECMELVANGKVRLDDIITHTVRLDEAPRMYDVFNNKAEDCVKVVLKP
jgi:alcohol dehydrogenase